MNINQQISRTLSNWLIQIIVPHYGLDTLMTQAELRQLAELKVAAEISNHHCKEIIDKLTKGKCLREAILETTGINEWKIAHLLMKYPKGDYPMTEKQIKNQDEIGLRELKAMFE